MAATNRLSSGVANETNSQPDHALRTTTQPLSACHVASFLTGCIPQALCAWGYAPPRLTLVDLASCFMLLHLARSLQFHSRMPTSNGTIKAEAL